MPTSVTKENVTTIVLKLALREACEELAMYRKRDGTLPKVTRREVNQVIDEIFDKAVGSPPE